MRLRLEKKIGGISLEETDYKEKFEELQKKSERLQEDYNRIFREKCDTDGENRELKSMNDRLLRIIENLSEGLTQ